MERARHWLRGDCHLHTTNSDGHKTPSELYEMLYRRGLDFAFITDHNFNTVGPKTFNYKGVTVIPGLEITGDLGHVNVFGEELPFTKIMRPKTKEEYYAYLKMARAKGAAVSVNHPSDRRFSWRVDLDTIEMDTVELWNAPMHTDNVYCMEWWEKELLKGRYIPAIGGSDYHQDYLGITHLLASPTTYVCAYSNTKEDILEAMKAGHVFVTNTPSAAKIFLTAGKAIPGDTVEYADVKKANVTLEHMFRGHTLNVYCNEKVILSHTAASFEKDPSFDFDVPGTGFIRAEIRVDLPAPFKKLYVKAGPKLHAHAPGEAVPTFIYSFTNPIFFR